MNKYGKLFSMLFLIAIILNGLILTNKINVSKHISWIIFVMQNISFIGCIYFTSIPKRVMLSTIITISIFTVIGTIGILIN